MNLDVLVVGGGPAGAAVATRLARAGRDVVLVERAPSYRWHAGGVFASPAVPAALRQLGLAETIIRETCRPIPAMRVETPRGNTFRLTYGDDDRLVEPAVGLDRERLDPALLDLARSAGVDVRLGDGVSVVERTGVAAAPMLVRMTRGSAPETTDRVRLVVGADGLRSVVARSMGVARRARFADRVGLTFHVEDSADEVPRDARMCVLRDGYIGIAPVPRGRVNIGIVFGASWRTALTKRGAADVVREIMASIPPSPDDPATWRAGAMTDAIAGASPIGHRVTHRAGPGWCLVGDAAGFLDPFTGEGLHRALVSAELAANALGPSADGDTGTAAYDRAMRDVFSAKDRVSWLVQTFLGRPAVFEYAARRLAVREAVRETVGLVMGDLIEAERALDPRFLYALLAP